MITALIAGLLVVLVNRSDHQLRLVVHRFRFDRHVDSDLSQQLKVTEVSSNRIAGRHFYLLFSNHHQAANHEGRLVVVPLDRNFRSLIHSLEHVARRIYELGVLHPPGSTGSF